MLMGDQGGDRVYRGVIPFLTGPLVFYLRQGEMLLFGVLMGLMDVGGVVNPFVLGEEWSLDPCMRISHVVVLSVDLRSMNPSTHLEMLGWLIYLIRQATLAFSRVNLRL